MKIAYFGTGEFSKNILKEIYKEIELKLVVSQEDKIVGRKKILIPTIVKKFTLKKNLEIFQPNKLKNPEFIEKLKSLNLDFIVVVAYGKIIPKEILEIPKYGCINMHPSILPKYRGATPIQEALKNGEKKTGVTIMYMSEKMDEGDILKIREIKLSFFDKTPDVFKKVEEIGPKLLLDTLSGIISSKIKGISQNHDKATYTKKIEKKYGEINFENENVFEIYNKFRAYFPWPGIFTYYKEKKFDIVDCSFIEKENLHNIGDVVKFPNDEIGGFLEKIPRKNDIGIVCNLGILILKKVKLEGKKELDINDFVNGNKDFLNYNFILKS